MTNRWVPASAGMTEVAKHLTSAASLFPFYFRDPREAGDQELRAPVILADEPLSAGLRRDDGSC